ncbi:uncharacterized protein LOC134655387 [Cydia amplana]|uniref:uncharacterized protein LOC134655387 n=1 Tax=Cydia amplana TaxID=1869771 RepID=UPI002FE563B7
MKQSLSKLFLLVCLSIARNCGMMIRNNALMSKMVSDFHSPKAHTIDIMRNVLCKNFPNLPCELITKDDTLRKLIQRTIRLLNEKQRNLQNVITTTTEEQTKLPVVNSDELSQYLVVENTGYFTDKNKHNKERHIDTPKTAWPKGVDKQAQRMGVFPSHKTIKKYFPHKIKYNDRNEISEIDKSREKMSNSEEIPKLDVKKYDHFNYKKPSNMPMWQIDYTKHGDPKIEFSQESDQLRGKLVKTGSDTENTIFKHKTGVLHPNVYIRNSAKRIQEYCSLIVSLSKDVKLKLNYHTNAIICIPHNDNIILKPQRVSNGLNPCAHLGTYHYYCNLRRKHTAMSRPVLSSHVLDISSGRPAVQLFTELFKQKGDSWVSWHSTVTTGDGRIQFPFTKDSMSAGTYKLKFNVGDYYTRNGKETLYPYVEIVFEVKENEHYHIPLLLSPYGYSTYRGS